MRRFVLALASASFAIFLPVLAFSQATQTDNSAALAGIPRAGTKGVGVPTCVYCPSPNYTDEARVAKINGNVVLQAVITPECSA
jgi:hypothetical protein